ncbi:DEAD/DEAH box helicase [Haloglycomyces albus]|uniref:DEAD/DEAH box helicase n=1 Tax=Haloglycomyces albus TaxID=526067 RepID=UPI00046D0C4E|nr:DEAD/DEAH box helicase [Haloglycomyces albus]
MRTPDLAADICGENLTHLHQLPSRLPQAVTWPDWATPELRDAFSRSGIDQPWAHQVDAATSAYDGHDTIVSTGTASGKSLAYLLPTLEAISSSEHAKTLYLSPTKALAVDQARAVTDIEFSGVVPAVVDGDTPYDERRWAAAYANMVFTNPDLLHHSLLPRHRRWRAFLSGLRYLVIDETHLYRGIFGSHMSWVVRRLLRLARHYHADPTVIAASATCANPADLLETLTGRPAHAVTGDSSGRPDTTVALTTCSSIEMGGETISVSTLSETARLLADLTSRNYRTLAFVPSRRGAEIVASETKDRLGADPVGDRIAAYRAGYLRQHRRELEDRLRDGSLMGLATTNALELGIDITGLDAVILCGYPGRLASFWQQVGRAGRTSKDALAVFIAKDDPLDTYLIHHPERLLEHPVEAGVCDPANPYVLAGHLCLAAGEKPLLESELEGLPGAMDVVSELCSQKLLRRRAGGRYYWVGDERPEVNLRGSGPGEVDIAEIDSGELIGTVDLSASHRLVHTGAVYVHQGQTFLVDELDLDGRAALVHRANPPWTTSTQDISHLEIIDTESVEQFGDISMYYGSVEVTNAVVSYQRRRSPSGEVIDTRPLDLPAQTLQTKAVWWTFQESVVSDIADLAGALHAAEHAAIGLLPLIATCDRWDIGGLSTDLHPDTETPTIFIYDGHPGGAGIAAAGYRDMATWLSATREAIADCGCERGCPSCIHSPKCGNGNDPLSKTGSMTVLDRLLKRAT